MKRREFMTVLGGVAVTWPLAAGAQQKTKIPTIGVLWHAGSEQEEAPFLNALRQGLRDLGYLEGQNIAIENRFPAEQYERFNALASELAGLNVDVLVAVTQPAALAAQRATTTIPVVFILVPDPVAVKLVESFGRPGGHITGLSQMALDLTAKRLEIFREAISLPRLALLVNPGNREFVRRSIEETEAAAAHLRVNVKPIEVSKPAGLENAFSQIAQDGIKGAIVLSDGMFWNERKQIAALALQHQVASMFAIRDHVVEGGLISYGPSFPALFQRAATYIDKILKGENPSELPVERPTKFQLVINLKAAKALGIDIPTSLLVGADEVIE